MASQLAPLVRNVAPLARNVGPLAKNAGTACRQGAQGAARLASTQAQAARSWAEPQVQAARSWAAPLVEQAGVAVREKIAPTISDALLEASHKLEGTPPPPARQPRRWPQLVAGIAMLAAAAGSAIAAVRLKRQAEAILGPEDQPTDGGPAPMPGWADGAARAADGPYNQAPGEGPYHQGPPGDVGPDDFLP